MAQDNEPSGARRQFGDFAPALVAFTDDTLFGQVWTRPELSLRDRSLVTVACLVAGVGTGGTISGTGRYLKDVSRGRVRVVGADPDGSVYSGAVVRPYLVEGVGQPSLKITGLTVGGTAV